MKLSIPSLVRAILVGAIILGAIVWLLDNVFNPTHINHLVLIRDLPNAVVWPFVAELDGEVQWKQNLDFHGGPGAAGPAGLVVADIHQVAHDPATYWCDKRGVECSIGLGFCQICSGCLDLCDPLGA